MTIKELRAEKNMKQEDVAKKIGCSTSMVALIETGKRKMPVDLAKKIGSAFGIPWHTLYPDSPYDASETEKFRAGV